MYGDYLDKYTSLLTNTEITTSSAKAETITNVVLNELKPKGIYIHKTIVISTDGASGTTRETQWRCQNVK